MNMSPKERFMATLAFEPVDRNVVYPLDTTAWFLKEAGLSLDQLYALDNAGAAVVVEQHNRLKSDVICAGNAIWQLGASAFSVDWMVNMKEMLETSAHQMVMIGNISPTDQLLMGTQDSVYEKAAELLEFAYANKGGLMLATGCDLPAGSPIENVHAMVKAAEDFAIQHK